MYELRKSTNVSRQKDNVVEETDSEDGIIEEKIYEGVEEKELEEEEGEDGAVEETLDAEIDE